MLTRMIFLFLGLNTFLVVAFHDALENGNAEERFSFDGHFDRIEHGGYGHKSHKGTNGGSLCIIVEFYIVTLYSLVFFITKYKSYKTPSLDLLHDI